VVALADDSRPRTVPLELRSVASDGVPTAVETRRADELTPREHACAEGAGFPLAPHEAVVERVDVHGTSVTFDLSGGQSVYGCISRSRSTSWCGRVLGRYRSGRLEDPRLDLGCRDRRGHTFGSAWIEAAPGARWIVARERGLVQIYPVVGPLPVRITTDAVDLPRASATFVVEQYDGAGTRIAFSIVRAAVAG
jgi:hypothetical protein